MTDQITKTVHDAPLEVARSTAFTPEALNQFNAALAEVKNLTNKVASLTYDKDRLQNENRILDVHLSAFKRREAELQTREEAIVKREATMFDLEKKTAVAEAKEYVRKEVFDTIFKNTIVRENISRSVSENQSGATYGTINKSGSDIVERTSE